MQADFILLFKRAPERFLVADMIFLYLVAVVQRPYAEGYEQSLVGGSED